MTLVVNRLDVLRCKTAAIQNRMDIPSSVLKGNEVFGYKIHLPQDVASPDFSSSSSNQSSASTSGSSTKLEGLGGGGGGGSSG